MNRSVITGMIAAAVLSAGAAVAGAAPAVADPVGSGTAADAVGSGTAADAEGPGAENDRTGTPRRRGHIAIRTPAAGAATRPHLKPNWPCPWPPIIPPAPSPGPAGHGGGGNGIGLIAALQTDAPAPLPRMVPEATWEPLPVELPELIEDAAQFDPAAPAEAVAETPTAQAVSGPVPVAVAPSPLPAPAAGTAPSPPAASAPPPPAAPLSGAGAPARTLPARPPQRPGPGGDPGVRLGYPEELRTAGLTQLAATALPGLAAIVGMTALGGLIGYRQAKAGYVLQASGAGRFLQ